MQKLEIDKNTAGKIISTVGQSGIPPEYGASLFSVGLDKYLKTLNDEYLSSFIKNGGSAFKMVVGIYGGGKTHFLYNVRDLAWQNNYAVSYISLSPNNCPFYQIDMVYKAIVRGLTFPLTPEELLSGYETGIVPFIQSWFSTKYQEYKSKFNEEEKTIEMLKNHLQSIGNLESISFANAVKSAFRALMNKKEDDFYSICQWLLGEKYEKSIHSRFEIVQRIDRSTALSMIRSLVKWIKEIGYAGLIILMDEAERVPSLSSKQKELYLNNLREIIDECGHSSFANLMLFYAVPDENFLEGRTQTYEALKQRLNTVFDIYTPTGVKIKLENISENPVLLLKEIGYKLKEIYEIAYNCNFDEKKLKETIEMVANAAYEHRYGDIGYRRLFVQKIIEALHNLRLYNEVPHKEKLNL